MNDKQLIKEACILARLLEANEDPAASTIDTCALLLREMRAETEAMRLAKRISNHYDCNGKFAPPFEVTESPLSRSVSALCPGSRRSSIPPSR